MASSKRLIAAALAAAMTISPGVAGAQLTDNTSPGHETGRGGQTIDLGQVDDIVGGNGGRGGLEPGGIDDYAGVNPALEGLWLADATTNALIEQISAGVVFDRADLPQDLTIVAVANGDTESVQFGWEGAIAYHVENHEPYALDGDAGGDLFASDIADGWHTVRARPFAADGASGSYGDEVLLSFGIFEETIVVESTLDLPDTDPGDGVCSGSLTGDVDDFAQRGAGRDDAEGSDQLTDGQRTDGDTLTNGASAPQRAQLNGPCTLRAAVEEANARSGRQTIELPIGGHFYLSRGHLLVSDTVSIASTGPVPVIDAQNGSQVFYIWDAGEVTIDGVIMRNGSGHSTENRGGVVFVSGADVTIRDSRITGGRANFGGGVYAQNGELTIERSVVADNVAGDPDDFGGSGSTQRGGGISTIGAVLTLDSSTVIGNRAVRGGGVSIAGGQGFILNTSILENEAAQVGGGFELIPSDGQGADVHMAWSTVARNQAGTLYGDGAAYRTGGGFHLSAGSLISANSIVAENSTDLSEYDDHWSPDCWVNNPGDFVSYRGNLVGVLNDNCVMHDSHLDEMLIDDMVGSDEAPLDPGFTFITTSIRPTIGLDANSPAVDHGTSAPGVEFYGYCPDFDGRDNPRPGDDSQCDIGATERP